MDLHKIPRYLPLIKEFPCGQVFSWRFQAEGKTLHFFGSAGSSHKELEQIRKRGPLDILLVPLQGHTHICDIAARYVKILAPKRVIPHHHGVEQGNQDQENEKQGHDKGFG